MSKEEEQEREEALTEVLDPQFPFARGDADADAEGEVDDVAAGVNGMSATTSRHQDAIDIFGQ